MKALIRKLAGETAVYGLSSMVGRFLNFLLVPLYTAQFLPEEYGVVTVLYAFAGFAAVILTMGMETAFFHFSTKINDTAKAYSHAFLLLLPLNILLGLIIWFGAEPLAEWVGFEGHGNYFRCFALILPLDALTSLPMAWLRKMGKARRFALLKLLNIAINIGVNLYFVYFGYTYFEKGIQLPGFNPDWGIFYIFIANVLASLIGFLCMIPELRVIRFAPDVEFIKSMLKYAWPVILIGLAGMVNELLDRVLIQYLTPAKEADFNTGVYGAFYKLSIVITLFVQAFRFAAEPFFFEQSRQSDAPRIYARVMHLFVAVCAGIFLLCMLMMDELSALLIRQEAYYRHPQAMQLVPVLLMANIFLGMYYNLSIWYKLSEKTRMGAWIAMGGAVLTIVLNFLLIPKIGILGAAWTTLTVYISMALISWLQGQRYYPVPYNVPRILTYLGLALGAVFVYQYVLIFKWFPNEIWQALALIGFVAGIYLMERVNKFA